MAELVRTNDPGLLSVIEGLLAEAEIPHHVADRDMIVSLRDRSSSSSRGCWCPMSGKRKQGNCSWTPT